MKRSKKGVSKRKEAKIKSKSRYGSRSKIKRVKSKKIKGGGGSSDEIPIDDKCTLIKTVTKEGVNRLFTQRCKTKIDLTSNGKPYELKFIINFSELYKKYDYKFEGKKTLTWWYEKNEYGREDHLHYDTA